MDLGYPRLADSHGSANFFHGEFLQVIEAEYLALPLVEFIQSGVDQRFEFTLQAQDKRVFLLISGAAAEGFLFALLFRGIRLLAGVIEPRKVAKQMLKFLEVHIQLRRDFLLVRRPAETGFQLKTRLFHALGLTAEIPRAPIHFTQAVQDGAANAELRVALQLDV